MISYPNAYFRIHYAFLSIWVVQFICNPVFAQTNVEEYRKYCEIRSAKLENSTFLWTVDELRLKTDIIPDRAKDIIRQVDSHADRVILDKKISDASKVQSLRNQFHQIAIDATKMGELKSSYSIEVSRNPGVTRFIGIKVPPEKNIRSKFEEYFTKDWCFFINPWGQVISTKEPMGTYPATVMSTRDEPIFVDADDHKFLDVSPYEASLLFGANPLRIFGNNWTQKGFKNENPVFENAFDYLPGEPCKITVILSKTKDYAPLLISFYYKTQTLNYETKSFRKARGTWITDRLEVYHTGNKPIKTWELKKLTNSEKINTNDIYLSKKVKSFDANDKPEFSDKPNDQVVDLRLVSTDLSRGNMGAGMNDMDSRVQYKWSGHVISLNELKQIKGHSNQMFVKNSPLERFWMFVPGVLLIGAGVFLKLRKSKLEKKETITKN